MRFKRGRNPSTPDPRTLRMSNYLDVSQLPPCPDSVLWSAKTKNRSTFLNTQLGCCTVSGIAALIEVWTANDSASQVIIPDPAILTAYSAVSGYKPGKPSTDNGSDCLTVAKYTQEIGVGGHKIIALVAVDPANLDQVRASLYLFGGLYAGADIPNSYEKDGTWGAFADDITGGHCFPIVDRIGVDFAVLTWAEIRRFTAAGYAQTFGSQPNAELYALLGPDWFGTDAKAPCGFDLPSLQNDVAILARQQGLPARPLSGLNLTSTDAPPWAPRFGMA